jgi:hypothetical protein
MRELVEIALMFGLIFLVYLALGVITARLLYQWWTKDGTAKETFDRGITLIALIFWPGIWIVVVLLFSTKRIHGLVTR